jgi:hypothetical protein
MKIQRISTILKKYVLSKMNSLQIFKVYLWEYRRKVELLHLQSQADLIKEFCRKNIDKIYYSKYNPKTIFNYSKLDIFKKILQNVFLKKYSSVFYLYIRKNSIFYSQFIKIIYHHISMKICLILNKLYIYLRQSNLFKEKNQKCISKEITNSIKVKENTSNINMEYENSRMKNKNRMVITSTQQIKEKEAEFENRKKQFYRIFENKRLDEEDINSSKRKFYWKPFHCQKSINLIEKDNEFNKSLSNNLIESDITHMEKKTENNFIIMNIENKMNIEEKKTSKKFYWRPYRSIESSKEIKKFTETEIFSVEKNTKNK